MVFCTSGHIPLDKMVWQNLPTGLAEAPHIGPVLHLPILPLFFSPIHIARKALMIMDPFGGRTT